MDWDPIHKLRDHVDVYDPSFPWRDGRPDWDTYRAAKVDERRERNKRMKQKRPDLARCVFVVENGMICGHKAYGKLYVAERDAFAPICEEHKQLFVKKEA